MTSLAGAAGVTVRGPELPLASEPLLASRVIGPLVVSTRSVKVATPLVAIAVVVPLNVPAEPPASATLTGPL